MLKAVQYSSLDASAISASNFDMSTTTAHEDCVVELTVQQQQQQQPASLPETAAQDPKEMEEFNVFRDYFGLCQVVMSFLKTVPLEESTEDENGEESVLYEEQREGRERRDSLGSAGSDLSSSNSVESVEVADIYYSAYNQGFVSQAFTEPVTSLMVPVEEKHNGLRPIPPSLLLERNFGTQLPAVQTAKKPQVCLHSQLYKLALKCGRV